MLERLYSGNINSTTVETFGRMSRIEIVDTVMFALQHPHLSQLPLPQSVRRRLI
jgi:hypothetical protein